MPLRGEPERAPEPLDGVERLRLLAGRKLVGLGQPSAECKLGHRAVDAGYARVGDERRRLAQAGCEPLDAADLDAHSAGGKRCVVGIADDSVCDAA